MRKITIAFRPATVDSKLRMPLYATILNSFLMRLSCGMEHVRSLRLTGSDYCSEGQGPRAR